MEEEAEYEKTQESVWNILKDTEVIQRIQPPLGGEAPEAHQSILEEAEKIVNSSRAIEYGDAEENFTRAASILESMLGTVDWIILGSKSHITADLMIKAMMAVKLARHAHKRKRDNLVDLCGYAELLSRVQRL